VDIFDEDVCQCYTQHIFVDVDHGVSEKEYKVSTFPVPSVPLAEAINDGFLLLNQDWQIIYANQRTHLLFRTSVENLLQQSIWALMPDESNSAHRRELERAVRDGIVIEFDVFYPNLYAWHEVRAVPLPEGLGLVLRDITDRQWLLRREAERSYLRTLFNTAPVAISLYRGPYHRIEFANILARQLVGERIVEGREFKEAFPEGVEQGFLTLLDEVYRTGEPYYAQEALVQIDRDGTGIREDGYFTFTYQALRGFDAKIDGVLAIGIEVTETVKARQRTTS
jgi:PAS domain-containing protein